MYVDHLIAPNTVNTLPQVTIDAISSEDGSYPEIDIYQMSEIHEKNWNEINERVSMESIMKELEDEGVASFEKSYHSCLASISTRLADFA